MTTETRFPFLRALVRRAAAVALGAVLVAAWCDATYAACPTCGSSPCTITGTHTIASGATCDYTGKDVILSGTLDGDGNADCFTVVARNLTVRGTLRARSSCIAVDVTEAFQMAVVSSSAATVDVRNADEPSDGLYVDCGTAALNGNAINADSDGVVVNGPDDFAGTIEIACDGNVSGSGGPFTAVGAGGDAGGDVFVTSAAGSIDLASAFDVSSTHGNGGAIALRAPAGGVTAGTGSRTLQGQAGADSTGATVVLQASGTVAVNGAINVSGAAGSSDGGAIAVEGSAVTTGTTWNARGFGDGWGGTIDVLALSGAGTVTTTTGSASWNATGSGDGFGGVILVEAIGTVSLAGDMDAGANGIDSTGGDIVIGTAGDLALASSSRLEVDATGIGASDGTIELTACNMTIAGDVDSRNIDYGFNDFAYAGTFTQSSGSSLLADTSSGNTFYCRCVDVSPDDGVCDPPATCASPPTLNGTVTPAPTYQPIDLDACS